MKTRGMTLECVSMTWGVEEIRERWKNEVREETRHDLKGLAQDMEEWEM